MQNTHKRKLQKGYTLVEVLVAFTIFSILLGGALNLLVTAANTQRTARGAQDVAGELSFLGEIMTRALRQAQKDLGPTCLSTRGWNYQVLNPNANGVGDGVRFVDRDNDCREFFLDSATKRIKDKNITEATEVFVTSEDLQVLSFRVDETGADQEDNIQPRLTTFLEIEDKDTPNTLRIRFQSTVTQRPLDIRK